MGTGIKLNQKGLKFVQEKVLKGENKRYRYRVGAYRVIYCIDKEKKKVIVTLIAPRPSAYRNIN